VLTALLLAALALPVPAGHLPENLLPPHGKPENTLAGINLQTGTTNAGLRKLGPPTRTVTAIIPNGGYLWQTGKLGIEVEVTRGRDKKYLDASQPRVLTAAGQQTTQEARNPPGEAGKLAIPSTR
jgi:hypothetical protein